jgi:isocitrate dehydrogenase (NAD+)
LEHEVVPGVVESLKVITKFCSERIAKYAFEYAYLNNRKTVTAVHKANIMKLADGLFLESCREIAKKYPGIKYNEIIVDNCCMQLVSKPEQFDVMVTPNLYGNLVANTAAGIAGGTGVMPGGNVGAEHAIFEQGASAGNVGDEKMVLQKKANPVAVLLSSAMMLRHLQFPSFADRLEQAVISVIKDGKYRTNDIGGDSTTQEIVDAVIASLD